MTTAERLKNEYLTEEWVCDFLGIAKKTLQARRSEGKNHPPYIKIGNTIMYPAQEFHAWVNKQRPIREIA